MAKEVPTGVKIISVLYFIFAFFLGLAGLLFFIAAPFARQAIESTGQFAALAAAGTAFAIVLGIIFIALGVFLFYAARGLWRLKNWAKITIIVLAGLGVLQSLVSIGDSTVSSVIWVVIYGTIIWYLGFNKETKNIFVK